jgi:hypothetical protein
MDWALQARTSWQQGNEEYGQLKLSTHPRLRQIEWAKAGVGARSISVPKFTSATMEMHISTPIQCRVIRLNCEHCWIPVHLLLT